MSGLEVAGIVLGSIPLIISALEHYKQGESIIKIWRNHERELKRLIRNLKIERVRLQNVLERLLIGIVPSNHIERMIAEPFGPAWHLEDVQRKIQTRLWTSSGVFEEILGDLDAAIQDMMRRFGLKPDEATKEKDVSSMARQLKRVGFAFKSSDHRSSLETMKECITGLESMLEQNIKMEPQRQQRSQGKLIRLLRDVSGSVYRALRSGLFCTCNHDLHLRLSSPCSTAGRDSDDETILQKLEFELALTYATDFDKRGQPVLWKGVCLRTLPPGATFNLASTPKQLEVPQVTISQQKNSGITVTGLYTATATTTCIQQATTTTAVLGAFSSLNLGPSGVKPVQGIDLCAEIRRNQKQVAVDCYGMVSDQTGNKVRMFGVYPQPSTERPDSWSVVSLKDVLANPSKFPPMSTPHRLRLAQVVSSSLLQLQQTPWVPDVLTSRDIVFLQKGPDAEVMYTDIFIAKSLPERAPKAYADKSVARGRCPALLSLGIVLLELGLGGTIESFRTQDEVPPAGSPLLLSEFRTAQRLLERRQIGSQRYSSAVKRCLWGEFDRPVLDLSNDDFRQEVYEQVVVLLEDNFKNAIGSYSVAR
ncbi:hypothetical protein CH63R_10357 [Colletotrichum higginsianum IMI 349063]|uniref:DUF7580 domain-containing protein n=1 Tax=Colletotrichum higginsianum (strain IMI 349063) TaxID=759273 RepID=A0A1B7Y2K2_COLHI|nr:uncharacterized protein CH63R_10357 [Colletotrichum higginsianum IMI 349063]OBR06237.1 hypothetical protein CH63R_10357 [Colletotrichum higginsianum IMI 349063]